MVVDWETRESKRRAEADRLRQRLAEVGGGDLNLPDPADRRVDRRSWEKACCLVRVELRLRDALRVAAEQDD